jgi:hypothetical protein
MQQKIGKFQFYFPRIKALDILKGIFLYVDNKKSFSSNPVKYNKCFQQFHHNYPNLFKDISLEDDSFLPYSDDIENAFTLAQDYKIIARPNPDFYPFTIIASKERLEKDVADKFSKKERAILKKIAMDFEVNLQE